MGNKPFTLIAAALFALAALIHAYRLIKHFTIVVGTHTINETVSIVAIVVAVILAGGLYRESKR